jgi:hypothetical protein
MRAIGVLVALIVFGQAAPVHADATDKKLADDKFIEGRDLLKASKFAEACAKFHEAQKFDEKAVVILLNLGLCYEKQGKNASALFWYRKTQTASTEAADPAAVKDYEDAARDATAKLVKVVSRVTLVINALPPDAVISIDNRTIDKNQLTVEVDAGPRVIEARAPGKAPSRAELVIKDGADKPFGYTFPALADAEVVGPSRTKRRVAGVLIAVGIVGAVALGTGLWANSVQDDYLEKAALDPMTDKPKTTMRIAGGLFVAGAAAGLAIGGYLFFTKPKESNRTAFAPVLAPGHYGVALSRGF